MLIVAAAQAEPRVALVIGNGGYDAKMGGLANPVNDAKTVAEALRKVGFDVDLETDLDQKAMKRALSRLGDRLLAAGQNATGLFYYGGHGLQVKGENYLVPIDADIQSEADVDIEGVAAAGVLAQMEGAANSVNIIILDACRNTPILRKTRGGSRGLARMDAPKGSFVAYSTAPGEVAEDGAGHHSPFAAALVEQLGTPEPIDKLFVDIRREVLAATGQKQTPWTSSSLVNEFYFASPVAGAVAHSMSSPTPSGVAPVPVDTRQIELTLWNSVAESGDVDQLQSYLDQYPNGSFAGTARAKIRALHRNERSNTNTAVAKAQTAPVGNDAVAVELEVWKSVANSSDPAMLQTYIDQYPSGSFVRVAKGKIAELQRQRKPPAGASNDHAIRPLQMASIPASNGRNFSSQLNVEEQNTLTHANQAAQEARDSAASSHHSENGVSRFGIGWQYVGQSKMLGLKRRYGVVTWADGTQYAGGWRKERDGYGICVYPDGTQYAGIWNDDLKNGEGVETRPDGTRYVGTWLKGKLNGFGARLDGQGNVVEQGYYESSVLRTTAQP